MRSLATKRELDSSVVELFQKHKVNITRGTKIEFILNQLDWFPVMLALDMPWSALQKLNGDDLDTFISAVRADLRFKAFSGIEFHWDVHNDRFELSFSESSNIGDIPMQQESDSGEEEMYEL